MKTWAEKIKPPEEGLTRLLNSDLTFPESSQPNPSDQDTDNAAIINASRKENRVGLVQNQKGGTYTTTSERIESS